MLQDLLAVLPLAVIVLIIALLCEWAVKRNWLPYWISRKVLHILAVGACAVAPLLVSDLLHLFYFVLPIWLGLIVLVARGKLMQDEQGRPAWGIVWFPLAYLILLLFAGENTALVVFPMAVLAVCDPLATIFGTLFARAYYELTGEEKSQTGNAAFFLGFIFLAAWLFPALGLGHEREDLKLLLILFGIIITATEALGSFGRDNFYIPLITAMLIQRLASPLLDPVALLITFALCIPFIWWTVRRGSLDLGGAIAASLLAMLVVVFSHWLMILPLILFFGSSVLVGKLFPSRVQSDSKAGQARDAWQVICNGGVYVGGVFFCTSAGGPLYGFWTLQDFELYSFYIPLIVISVANADTWASEIGQHYRQTTYDILRIRKVPPGLSGGISLSGSIGAICGAAFIASFVFFVQDPTINLNHFLLITAAGFIGMLIDSVLGSALQAKYLTGNSYSLDEASPSSGEQSTPCEARLTGQNLSDQASYTGQKPIIGFFWMSNDWVNLLSQLLVVGILLMLL